MKTKLSSIYLISYVILLFSSIFEIVNNNHIAHPVFLIGAFVFILLNIILYLLCHSYNNYVITLFLLILLFIIGEIFHYNIIPLGLIILYILFLNIHVTDLRNFLKVDLFTKVGTFFIIIVLSLFNIVHRVSGNDLNFGFVSPNSAGIIIFSIVCSLILWYYHKKTSFDSNSVVILFLCVLLIFLFYHFTYCRALLVSGLFILICCLFEKVHIIKYFILKSSLLIGIFLVLISIFAVYKYNPLNNGWLFLNHMLSNRLSIQSIMVQLIPLKLNGRGFSDPILNNLLNRGLNSYLHFNIDNSYLMIAYDYGFIGLLIVMFVILRIIYISSKSRQYLPCVVLLSLLIYSCIDSDLLSFYNFTPMLYIILSSES